MQAIGVLEVEEQRVAWPRTIKARVEASETPVSGAVALPIDEAVVIDAGILEVVVASLEEVAAVNQLLKPYLQWQAVSSRPLLLKRKLSMWTPLRPRNPDVSSRSSQTASNAKCRQTGFITTMS